MSATPAADAQLELRIFAAHRELSRRRMDLAHHFLRLARSYRNSAVESMAVAEDAAHRFARAYVPVDEFDRLTPDILARLEGRDESGDAGDGRGGRP